MRAAFATAVAALATAMAASWACGGHKCPAFFACVSTQAEADRLNGDGCDEYHVCSNAPPDDTGDGLFDAGATFTFPDAAVSTMNDAAPLDAGTFETDGGDGAVTDAAPFLEAGDEG